MMTLRRQSLSAVAGAALIGGIALFLNAIGDGAWMRFKGSPRVVLTTLEFCLLVFATASIPVVALTCSRSRLLKQSADNSRLLTIIEEASEVGHWWLDCRTQMVFVSPTTLKIHGTEGPDCFSLDEAIMLYHPEDHKRIRAFIDNAIKQRGGFEFEAVINTPHGKRYVRSRGASDLAPDGRLIRLVVTLQDITACRTTEIELVKAREAAEAVARIAMEAAEIDPLTGIANRRRADIVMEQQFARAASGAFSLSVAVVDIDHFKTINDTYGHPVGDTVLRRVTDAAGRALRADDMIARLGGEEFLIILPEADRIEALSVAERVRLAVSESCRHLEPPVTVSIGIATFADDPTAGGLLARADAALYLAKSAGRNSLRMAV